MGYLFYLLAVLAALCAYLIGGLNSAIIISKLRYKKDIRQQGSGNPGFTNFRRVFGNNITAWSVLLMDLLKNAIPIFVFSFLAYKLYGMWQVGASFTGFFCMLGNAYPVWYKFKGGKTFVSGIATMFFVDYRAALCAGVLFALVLFSLKYMSLSSMTAAVSSPILLSLFGVSHPCVLVFAVLGALLLLWRHRANISRLAKGTESKFSLFKT